MKQTPSIFNRILRKLGLKRLSRPEDIPKKLSHEALQKAMHEARFLTSNKVYVKSLAADEEPGAPQRADL